MFWTKVEILCAHIIVVSDWWIHTGLGTHVDARWRCWSMFWAESLWWRALLQLWSLAGKLKSNLDDKMTDMATNRTLCNRPQAAFRNAASCLFFVFFLKIFSTFGFCFAIVSYLLLPFDEYLCEFLSLFWVTNAIVEWTGFSFDKLQQYLHLGVKIRLQF